MLQLKKCAPFEATILLTPDPSGIDSLYTVVKGTFHLSDQPVPAPQQLPIVVSDKYRAEPVSSSISVPADVSLIKPGTDVLMTGFAHAPGGRPVTHTDVSLRVGTTIQKTVRVFGDRVWKKGIFGTSISDPAPFTKIPLVWERAFGGSDATEGDPPKTAMIDANPVGAGFRMKKGQKELDGLKLPNLENPKDQIRSLTDHPPPAAFAPISPHWQPRRSFAGTYDEAWQTNRSPYLPADFDSRFFQCAPPGLVSPRYLQGGEEVEARGVTPSGVLRFRLPQCSFEVIYHLDNSRQPRSANLDTVLIEPEESRLVLVWRAVFPCDKKAMKVKEIEVTLKSKR